MLLCLFASPLHSVGASIFAVCKINLQENKFKCGSNGQGKMNQSN